MTKILIVDDSPAEVRLMQSVLDRAGFSCVAVHDATRLEQTIEKEKPNLILLDVIMPQRNGFQACRELKGHAAYAQIPVVIISSKGSESDKFWGKEQGADGYVVKPFSNEELLRTVRNLVKKKLMPDEPGQIEPLMPEAQQMELLPQPEAEPLRQYCVFRSGRERFCFSVLDVEEVVEWPGLTRVPLAPRFLMGIFNLRGSIVPVVDIAFSEGRRPDLSPRHVVVASLPAEGDRDYLRIGIAADEVIGTYNTAEPLLVTEAPRHVPHCCGMLHHQGRLALALNLKKLTEVFPVGVI